ncbi:MAG: hypothetical protein ACI8SR_001911 [Oceanicoccus sp.]|jgi:uncharacterized protein YjaG (DUF416 family)
MDFSALNHWQQLAFCASLCERSMPNFQLFCEIENKEEDFKQGRRILNKIWEYLRGQLTSLKNIENQLDTLTDLIPEPDQYEHFGVYPAMDCMVNLQSCLQAVLDNSILDAENIQTMTHERLSEVLEMQGIAQSESELWLRQHDFEQALFSLLNSHSSHADMVKKLLPLSKDQGVSQIGICLDD